MRFCKKKIHTSHRNPIARRVGSVDSAVDPAVGWQSAVAKVVIMVAVGVAVADLVAVQGCCVVAVLVAIGVAEAGVATGQVLLCARIGQGSRGLLRVRRDGPTAENGGHGQVEMRHRAHG